MVLRWIGHDIKRRDDRCDGTYRETGLLDYSMTAGGFRLELFRLGFWCVNYREIKGFERLYLMILL